MSITIFAARAADEPLAMRLSHALDLPITARPHGLHLRIDASGVALHDPAIGGPLQVDFASGQAAHRRQYGGGFGQALARAVGIKPQQALQILDATAGLGRDAFVLASLGAEIWAIEQHPVLGALWQDGLQRAQACAETAPIVARMHLQIGEASAMMRSWRSPAIDVVYLDPMYPARDKSAQVKKPMQYLQALVGADSNDHTLLEASLALAQKRVVVKRPKGAPYLANLPPHSQIQTQTTRYDLYRPSA